MIEPKLRSDGQLLAEFAATGSQTAFAQIVERHGAMVQAVARRVVGDYHEAQDVTQAAFLTLARKAASLRKDSSVGAWLHHVAWCLAQDARKTKHRRAGREVAAMRERELTEPVAVDPRAFQAELDAAINQLAERYRRPLVLFHLEGQTLQQTAAQLGLNPATTGTRLSRARELLRKKLVRRGVTVGSVGALTALLSAESGAAVLPATFVASTVSAAMGDAVSTTVAALSKGALHMLFIAQVKTVSLAFAACLVVAGTGVVVAQQATKPNQEAPAQSSSALSRDQLIAAADREAIKAWPQHKPNVRAPGFFIAHKPDGCVRDINVERQAGLWNVSVAVRLFIAGKQNQIGNVLVPLNDTGMLAGTVVFEGFENPRPPAAPAPAAEQTLRFTEADNGKTVTVKVGRTFEVVLLNGREGAGWEPAATEITGTSVELVNKLRRGNCDERMAEKAPTPDTTLGMYKYKYNAVKPGTSIIRVVHVYPSGPTPKPRRATLFISEFKLIVEVTADDATAVPAVNEYQAQQLAQLWVSGLLAGRVDQVLAVSDLPFCWNRRELNKGGSGTRDDIGLLKTAADLQAKLEAVVKQQGVRNLAVSDATVLSGEQAVNYGAARFKQLDVPGIAYVQVKTGQRRVQVAIQPGAQLKVVGFAEMIGFGENAGVE